MDKVITYRPLTTDVVVDEKGNYFYEDLSMCED
jgi:hypothetical protein